MLTHKQAEVSSCVASVAEQIVLSVQQGEGKKMWPISPPPQHHAVVQGAVQASQIAGKRDSRAFIITVGSCWNEFSVACVSAPWLPLIVFLFPLQCCGFTGFSLRGKLEIYRWIKLETWQMFYHFLCPYKKVTLGLIYAQNARILNHSLIQAVQWPPASVEINQIILFVLTFATDEANSSCSCSALTTIGIEALFAFFGWAPKAIKHHPPRAEKAAYDIPTSSFAGGAWENVYFAASVCIYRYVCCCPCRPARQSVIFCRQMAGGRTSGGRFSSAGSDKKGDTFWNLATNCIGVHLSLCLYVFAV